MAIVAKIVGAIGMLIITTGIISKSALTRNWLFTLGGLCLLAYSIYLRDPIFIPLQIIFTSASLWEIYKLTHRKI